MVGKAFSVSAALAAALRLGLAAQAATASAELGLVAQAQLGPIDTGNVSGVILFQEVGDFVRVWGVVRNLTPGKHGFHIHEGTSCDQRGEHFAPWHGAHGSPDGEQRHVGDLGNLASDHDGDVEYLRIDRLIQLSGPQSIVGRVLVVTQDEDDYVAQPSGDSGEPIACGTIELETS